LIITDERSLWGEPDSRGGDSSAAALTSQPQPQQQWKPSCWNCGGEHLITTCPKPKNPHTIAQNKKKFLEAKARRQGPILRGNEDHYNNRRYHEEPRGQQSQGSGQGGSGGGRWRGAVPGMVGNELRKAMGLADDQLPPYIYRMRIFGYPPGWKESAVEEARPTALKLYGGDLSKEKNPCS
jgi:hypothetical protein